MSSRIKLFLILICLSCSTNLKADIINYGDLEGPGMFFIDITESSIDSSVPLFGPPAMAGDMLVFDNPGFNMSVDNNELDFVDGRLTVTITGKNNRSISSLSISEFGGYEIMGPNALVSVSGIGFAFDKNEIVQSDFQFLTSDAGVGSWAGNLVFDFANPVNSISLVMDNQLFATAGDGSSANVYKDRIEISVTTIPEPAATMGLAAVFACGLIRRKR